MIRDGLHATDLYLLVLHVPFQDSVRWKWQPATKWNLGIQLAGVLNTHLLTDVPKLCNRSRRHCPHCVSLPSDCIAISLTWYNPPHSLRHRRPMLGISCWPCFIDSPCPHPCLSVCSIPGQIFCIDQLTVWEIVCPFTYSHSRPIRMFVLSRVYLHDWWSSSGPLISSLGNKGALLPLLSFILLKLFASHSFPHHCLFPLLLFLSLCACLHNIYSPLSALRCPSAQVFLVVCSWVTCGFLNVTI
jgi:hypothetical protein